MIDMEYKYDKVLVLNDAIGFELHTPLKVFMDGDISRLIGQAHPYFDGNKLIIDIESMECLDGAYPAIIHVNKSVKGISVSMIYPNEDKTIPAIQFNLN